MSITIDESGNIRSFSDKKHVLVIKSTMHMKANKAVKDIKDVKDVKEMISFIRFIGTYDYWDISRTMKLTIIFVYFFAKWQNDRVIFRQKENISNREIVQKLTTVREKHFINRYQTFFPFEKEGKVHFNIFENQSYEEPKTTRLAWFKVRAQPLLYHVWFFEIVLLPL